MYIEVTTRQDKKILLNHHYIISVTEDDIGAIIELNKANLFQQIWLTDSYETVCRELKHYYGVPNE